MKCQRCKEREANVQIVQQEIGKKPQTFMLCDVCAREMGISIPTFSVPVKLNNPFAAMGNAFQTTFGIGADDLQRRRVARCSRCNLSFDEFRKTGFLGCPECYDAFGTQLDPVFCRTQMGKKHIGRRLAEKTRTGTKKKPGVEEPCSLEEQIKGVGMSLELPDDKETITEVMDLEIKPAHEVDSQAILTASVSQSNHDDDVIQADSTEPVESAELMDMEKTHRKMLITQKSTELEAAVSREDYLTAAVLRDEIAKLKAKGV